MWVGVGGTTAKCGDKRANRHRVDTDTDTSKDTDTEWQSVGIKDLQSANRHRAPLSFSVAQRYEINHDLEI